MAAGIGVEEKHLHLCIRGWWCGNFGARAKTLRHNVSRLHSLRQEEYEQGENDQANLQWPGGFFRKFHQGKRAPCKFFRKTQCEFSSDILT